jgi:lauroyl/myristoyl acyltransferase
VSERAGIEPDRSPPPEPGADVEQGGSYRFLRAAEWVGMRVPRPVGLWAGERFMRIQMRRSPEQRAVVAANMAQVLGHPVGSALVERATEECFRLYGRYWYETFALRSMPRDEVNRRFTCEGIEHIDEGVRQGRGFIAALPHMGNWDAAGHWLSVNGYRMTAVAEELRPKAVFDLFLRHRRALGMGIVPLTSDGRAGEELVRLLADNEVITLVADRDLTERGVRVEMFGAPRLLPAGPAYLSLATGSPMSVAAVFTTDEGWHCRINPPLSIERSGDMRRDVTAMTKLVAEQFEAFIASSPTDWHMFQPAWPELPEPAASPGSKRATAASPT